MASKPASRQRDRAGLRNRFDNSERLLVFLQVLNLEVRQSSPVSLSRSDSAWTAQHCLINIIILTGWAEFCKRICPNAWRAYFTEHDPAQDSRVLPRAGKVYSHALVETVIMKVRMTGSSSFWTRVMEGGTTMNNYDSECLQHELLHPFEWP